MLQEKFFPLLRRVLEEYVFSLPMELFQMLQFANRVLLVESWHMRHVLWFVLFYVIFSCTFVEFRLVNWNVWLSVIRINQIWIYGLSICLCTAISRAMLVLEFLLCMHSWPPIPYCMFEQVQAEYSRIGNGIIYLWTYLLSSRVVGPVRFFALSCEEE